METEIEELRGNVVFFKRAAIALTIFAGMILLYDLYQVAYNAGKGLSFLPAPIAAIAAMLWYSKRHFEKLTKEEQDRALTRVHDDSCLNPKNHESRLY